MRNISVANQLALSNARDKGIKPRDFFSIWARDRETGDPVEICLWSGDEDVTLEVISGTTGLPVERVFYGGVNLERGEIVRSSDFTIQSLEVSFSAIAQVCKSIVFEHDPRLAKAELHEGWIDTASGLITDDPEIEFLGEVDGAPVTTGSVGQDSKITLKLVSDAISMLARRNPRKRSYEAQKRRSGDEFGKYRNSTQSWQVKWGG